MSQEGEEIILPDGFTWSFWQAAAQETGIYSLNMILLKASLEKFVEEEKKLPKHIPVTAAELSAFQGAMRQYYGRGTRGILMRIGNETCRKLLNDLPYARRLILKLGHFLPAALSARLAMNELKALIHYPGSAVSVNIAGKDLYYMDFTGLGCADQGAEEPVCWMTVGLIQGVLESVTRQDYEVEELTCRATGSETCKFRVRPL